MSVVKLTYKQEELIHNCAKKCDFENFEVDANIGTFKGDNYLGVITTITLKEKNSEKILHLILKSAHTNENFRKAAPIAKAFACEAYMYNTILPRIFELQSEKGISEPFTGVAKFYDSCLDDGDESILLKDLKKNGYKLWNRKLPMDDQHVTMVFSEYARFHAASLALKHHYPVEFDQLTERMQLSVFESSTLNEEQLETFINMYFKAGFSGVEGNIKATTALQRLHKNMKTLFLEFKQNRDRSNEVVIHGDSWCNNMLFHYEDDSSTPNKVCFIDWQISKVGSPTLDLAYFFCVCGAKEVVEQLPKYLHIYYEVLSNNLKEFGCDPEKVFSFDTLMDHWKKNVWYGVFIAMMILKMMLSDSEEVPDMVESTNKGGNIVEAFEFTISNLPAYKKRLSDLVEFMADNNYI